MKFNSIYLIDDDIIFHFIIKKYFLKINKSIQVNYFTNGFDAINNLISKKNLPDLIFLDINMPIIDGWQFVEEFKKIKNQFKKDISIYIITSSNHVIDREKAEFYNDDIKKYYIKPISLEEFKLIFT